MPNTICTGRYMRFPYTVITMHSSFVTHYQNASFDTGYIKYVRKVKIRALNGRIKAPYAMSTDHITGYHAFRKSIENKEKKMDCNTQNSLKAHRNQSIKWQSDKFVH